MTYNAYILDWTTKEYEMLKQKLKKANFDFIKEKNKLHIRVRVSFDRVEEFSSIVKSHLNAEYNYVDIQFPHEKKTVIVFSGELAFISNPTENEAVRKWAIAKGLPPKQADWRTSYIKPRK